MGKNKIVLEKNEAIDFSKTFIDDADEEPLLTQDLDHLAECLINHKLITLNETLIDTEIEKKSNAYYVKKVNNHIEIGHARVEFYR